MRNLILLAVFVLLLSCSKDDDCGCTQVRAGGFLNEGYDALQSIKLCNARGYEVDNSTFPPTITNKSSEQLAAASYRDGCDRD